jgi:hypothetical protein
VTLPSQHQTVLLREAVDALEIKPAGTYVDGTFGRGGHSRAILDRLGPDGRLLALDRDPDAVALARETPDRRLRVMHQSFSELTEALRVAGIDVEQGVDGVLLDIGVSSPQLDQGERGDSAFVMTHRWICGWIRRRARLLRSGCSGPACRRLRRSSGIMGKNGLLSRLQRRLWLLGESGRLQPRVSSQPLYARPCGPASLARTRRRVPFKLYGFISIKSSSSSR